MSDGEYIAERRRQAEELAQLYRKSIKKYPIVENRIVFSTFEGDGGYCCNPKYIAEEMIKRGKFELVWLTHEPSKHVFPEEIKVVKDTVENQVYWLSTAKVWIDNYRKPWGTVKREEQIYIQTWHASLGFKAVGLFRGDKFPEIARLVSEADSALIDYMVSNSEYCDRIYPRKLLYSGPTIRCGSPRCDCLFHNRQEIAQRIRSRYALEDTQQVVLYAPTFRGGTQGGRKKVASEILSLDFEKLQETLAKKLGGEWVVFLRLHPQLAAKLSTMPLNRKSSGLIDVSQEEDMSELLCASNAVVTDYSSCAFDAMYADIPVFLYADDIQEYIENRGTFMWEKDELPFPIAEDNIELTRNIENFDIEKNRLGYRDFIKKHKIVETGCAGEKIVDFLIEKCK